MGTYCEFGHPCFGFNVVSKHTVFRGLAGDQLKKEEHEFGEKNLVFRLCF